MRLRAVFNVVFLLTLQDDIFALYTRSLQLSLRYRSLSRRRSDLSFGLSDIDQLIQGALNQATSTPALTTIAEPLTSMTSSAKDMEFMGLETEGALSPLGNDLLIFFCTTIGIVPLFKWLKASSVIGFLTAGLIMGPAGMNLFSDLKDMDSIADFGVLFLLFEQGLELTVDRLKSLSKYAFGMGTLQVILCTAAFFIFPFIGGVQFLEMFMGSAAALVDIERVDEALVIGAALSLSSSAFVLKILQEKGQLATKFGAACLGILLLQDIAVVPLLVLLPIIESNSGPMPLSAQLALLGATFVKAILGLGGILVVGGGIVRFLFTLVAKTGSSETFVALCLLVALGTGALTDQMGLSSTLGAFTAGTLLAESNYRTQIESDIKPFRGLLLGLFFLTTGASVDPVIIYQQWPTVLALLGGLLVFKAGIITALGPFFGLSKSDSIRTGLLLSGGGEFAFVVLTLADKLKVLPDILAKLLVGVVVISMAITPYLGMLADKVAGYVEKEERKLAIDTAIENGELQEPGSYGQNGHESPMEGDVVIICGFSMVGQTIAQLLSEAPGLRKTSYVAFDLDPDVVTKAHKSGKRVLYGDGSQPKVLITAGIENPHAFVVTHSEPEVARQAVERLRLAYPSVPILSRATSEDESLHLLEAGATRTVSDERESAFRAAQVLVKDILTSTDTSSLEDLIFEVRLREESLANDKLEVMMLKKAGVINMLRNERFSRSDTKGGSVGRAANFMDKMGIADFLGDKFSPMMDGGNPFKFSNNNDNEQEQNNSTEILEGITVVAVTDSGKNSPPTSSSLEPSVLQLVDDPLVDAAMGEEELGVLICAMPPRKSKTSSDSSEP